MTLLIFQNTLNYKFWNKRATFSLSILFILIAKLSFMKEGLKFTVSSSIHENTVIKFSEDYYMSKQTSLQKSTEKTKTSAFCFYTSRKPVIINAEMAN